MKYMLLLMLCTHCVSAAQISVSDEYPLVHNATTISIRTEDGSPLEGGIIRITYRPNSMVERTVILDERTNDLGSVPWTPDDSGLSTISASLATQPDSLIASTDISVRFKSFSIHGIIVFIVAFIVLFGGTTVSVIMLFRP